MGLVRLALQQPQQREMDPRVKIILSIILQIFHLALAGGLLMLGFVVFIYSAPLFDLLGPGERNTLPDGVFKVR